MQTHLSFFSSQWHTYHRDILGCTGLSSKRGQFRSQHVHEKYNFKRRTLVDQILTFDIGQRKFWHSDIGFQDLKFGHWDFKILTLGFWNFDTGFEILTLDLKFWHCDFKILTLAIWKIDILTPTPSTGAPKDNASQHLNLKNIISFVKWGWLEYVEQVQMYQKYTLVV